MASKADGTQDGATAAQLRADIDSGRTGDKGPASDPAAAPLGTDDEAAGAPPLQKAVARSQRHETAGPEHAPRRSDGPGHAWILIGVVGVAVAGLAVAAMVIQ